MKADIEPILLSDRISVVLGRDERMLDVLLAASPTFAHLKNPIMRKTMAKLATVEHAARVAGLDAQALLDRLNQALLGDAYTPTSGVAQAAAVDEPEGPKPDIVANATAERILDCDVREDLNAGREPLARILGDAVRLPEGHLLKVRAIFEPAPLYSVLGKKGLTHFTERLADDDWVVWFWRDAAGAAEAAQIAPADASLGADEDAVVLDVRGLEPPEPMMRTLEALEQLPRGKTLIQLNVRVPQFLIPRLLERGFTYEVREQSADLVRLFIRHADT